MNLFSKILLFLIFIWLMIAIYVFLVDPKEFEQENILKMAIDYGSMLAAILLLINSGIIQTPWIWKLLAGGFAVLLGALMKIMHLPAANLILLLGMLTMLIVYTIRFSKKTVKNRLDILKYLWVLSTITFRVIIVLHLVSGDLRFWLLYLRIDTLLLMLCVMEFLYRELKSSELEDSKTG